MDPAIFPEEIWIKILLYCDVPDIIAFGSTCKYLRKTSDIDYLWKMKWLQLISKVQFRFPDVKCLQLLSVSFKAMCYRLHMVIALGESAPFPKCYHCSEYTCQRNCVEGSSAKVGIEIGNRCTWVSTPQHGVRRHFSLFGIPKYNNKRHTEQVQMQNIPTSSAHSKIDGKSIARKLNLLKVRELSAVKVPKPSGPFCIFCNSVKLYREKRRLIMHRNDPSFYTLSNTTYQKLVNGYCTDIVEIFGIPNVDVVNPAEALSSDGTFYVLKTFVDHLFHQMGLTATLRKPNAVLMFCEPLTMHPILRKQLLHYLFQEVKVARVCLVPKPLAACAMLDIETCVIVDSGALSTTVAVVIGGRVVPHRWKVLPVGGWHVAYHLKQAMHWHPKEYHRIPITYLDTIGVKERCRLSYNIQNEELKRGPTKREHIDLWVDSYADYKRILNTISLGSELYMAPEMMYISLGLPQVIQEVTLGLSEELIHDCLSHVLVTGGNTDLSGFELRLTKDLKELLPEHSGILEVKSCPGPHSWHVAVGSTYVPLAVHPDKTPPEYVEGNPFWLSREEYVLFGCESLEQ
ncbi:actin-related protein 6-like [Orussus abietinus]|uniref:actin-related protein 6-like n=1 Tax=Orussus abietinus TaxID=222816 RepID=UPI0006257A08|nr:actin-related protein 6-like [Orussus abietinus]XP_012280609.1 actin-related protein 6-like [Orussus abietinus]